MTYKEWLQAAYDYYWGHGSDVPDGVWDFYARQWAAEADKYDELRGKGYEGGSLFWLKKHEYPDWIIR